ncbi:MAG TPA: polysaccharide ABC transporter ATP-binding protein, partial [Pyrinomonadaceae bacterium]
MKPIIKAENVSKQYHIGPQKISYDTLRETLADKMRAPFKRLGRNGSSESERFWALKDINFEVYPGEILGIIGRNGAGKSTLLKILSRITDPTSGRVELYGRVGSLLEVGTGFHPELSGRENIFLNGTILGMSRREITRKFDEIVAFAEVERFLDTPVKRYSSGMYVRLAFAVAAHLEPEILLVDEVLAVGDVAFQKKCLGKMGEVASEGRTVLFVSHDMRAIRSLCSSAIHLQSGQMVMKGEVREAIGSYAASASFAECTFPVGTEDVVVHNFSILQNGARVETIDGSLPFDVKVNFEVLRDLNLFRTGIYLKTPVGDTVLRSFIADWHPEREDINAGTYEATLSVPGRFLMGGNYLVSFHASRYGIVNYFADTEIQQLISVSTATEFNSAHLSENVDSSVIMQSDWQVVGCDS